MTSQTAFYAEEPYTFIEYPPLVSDMFSFVEIPHLLAYKNISYCILQA